MNGVLTNMWGDTSHVEILGMLDYDFLWVEAEHGTPSPSDCERLYLAAERRGLPTITRVGYGQHLEPGLLQKYLVGGSQGIILPQCESALDVQRIVDAVKFPPIGRRGLAGEGAPQDREQLRDQAEALRARALHLAVLLRGQGRERRAQ